ncbi:class I SAM-dependent methyltransferase [Phyllobacterium zundukense]|uniref:Class I SAM-dependent methyltransferase n=1 Tax=Phyllobacterium zundukense TaxID=1867719 RepID=A0ACD4CZC5_9HYPH|nr:class I SAM-dependent methyltransferase [Phyllobacterium zundukense]UXN58950.1 class I SAM-dependent methyltransferase [Phyllobacterium zundukense]
MKVKVEQGKAIIEDAAVDHSDEVAGLFYTTFLLKLHENLKPKTYFEIGTLTGGTLALSSCRSLAVDPFFQVTNNVLGIKPSCTFIQEGSDSFFRHYDPVAILGDKIDLAFLDGMHLFEFLLRDFFNTERYCRRNSIIALHDCLPPGFNMTVRDPDDPRRAQSNSFSQFWTGDVWKIVPALRKYCPELKIEVFDCAPTGLVLITNLNPDRANKEDIYDKICDEFSEGDIDRASYDSYWSNLKISKADSFISSFDISVKYWL